MGKLKVPKLDLCLYHWSPRERRKRIKRHGFVPGSWSLAHDWRPPYNCFSDDALLAWFLSGRIHPEIDEWDLWMVCGHDAGEYEIIMDTFVDTGRHYVKEYRVYHPMKPKHIHYIASRTHAKIV